MSPLKSTPFLQTLCSILTNFCKSTLAIGMFSVGSKDTNLLFLLLLWLITVCGDTETNHGPDFNPALIELSVLHLNIRSLRNKIHVLGNIASEYHVICVTE